MTDKLKPCPFCGADAVLKERHNEGYSVYGRFWYSAGCAKCHVYFSDREEFDENRMLKYPAKECIAAWNTRADGWNFNMDEAPKDGTQVLLGWPDRVATGRWVDGPPDENDPLAWKPITLPEVKD